MKKEWLVVQCDTESAGMAIKEVLIKQGVDETHNILICSRYVTVTLNGKELTPKSSKDDEGLTAKQIDNIKTMLERRCNDHFSVDKTIFNWLVWPFFIVAVLIVLTWICER